MQFLLCQVKNRQSYYLKLLNIFTNIHKIQSMKSEIKYLFLILKQKRILLSYKKFLSNVSKRCCVFIKRNWNPIACYAVYYGAYIDFRMICCPGRAANDATNGLSTYVFVNVSHHLYFVTYVPIMGIKTYISVYLNFCRLYRLRYNHKWININKELFC